MKVSETVSLQICMSSHCVDMCSRAGTKPWNVLNI